MLIALWMIIGGVFGAVTGLLAIRRNRSGVQWWATGTVLGPIGLGWLLLAPRRTGERPSIL